jgi:hypothetical protein
MNRKQRESNRKNARDLYAIAKSIRLSKHICEECGKPGGHWVSTRGSSLQAMITGVDDQEGFWVCDKFYDENGHRIMN